MFSVETYFRRTRVCFALFVDVFVTVPGKALQTVEKFLRKKVKSARKIGVKVYKR